MSPAKDMSCQELVEIVTDFVEGRMPIEERSQFEQHLVYCTPCVEYVRQVRKTVEMAGKAPVEAPDEHVEKAMVKLFRDWRAAR